MTVAPPMSPDRTAAAAAYQAWIATLDAPRYTQRTVMACAEAGYPGVQAVKAGDHVMWAGPVPPDVMYRASVLSGVWDLLPRPPCFACWAQTPPSTANMADRWLCIHGECPRGP